MKGYELRRILRKRAGRSPERFNRKALSDSDASRRGRRRRQANQSKRNWRARERRAVAKARKDRAARLATYKLRQWDHDYHYRWRDVDGHSAGGRWRGTRPYGPTFGAWIKGHPWKVYDQELVDVLREELAA